jgi:hypothetical protein
MAKASTIEAVKSPESAPGKDRRDSVVIGDTVHWWAPSNNRQGRPCPAIVLFAGGRRTLSLYVLSEAGPRIVSGARHWTDSDFSNPLIDASQLSSWSFKDE